MPTLPKSCKVSWRNLELDYMPKSFYRVSVFYWVVVIRNFAVDIRRLWLVIRTSVRFIRSFIKRCQSLSEGAVGVQEQINQFKV